MATLGYTTIGGSGSNPGGDFLSIQGAYQATEDGTLVSLSQYCYFSGGAYRWRGVIYSTNTNPATFVDVTAEVIVPASTPDWYTGNFDHGAALVDGQDYYIGIWLRTGDTGTFSYDGWGDYPTHKMTYNAAVTYAATGDPPSLNPASSVNLQYSCYVTYTPGEAPANLGATHLIMPLGHG